VTPRITRRQDVPPNAGQPIDEHPSYAGPAGVRGASRRAFRLVPMRRAPPPFRGAGDVTQDVASLLGHFALGYLAVLAAPGPNVMAIGMLATLRGLRGVLPFVVGIATGAGALAFGLLVAFGTVAEGVAVERVARAFGGAVLLLVALRVMRTPRPAMPDVLSGNAASLRDGLLSVLAGFCTAATNPITGAYFAAQFLGPLRDADVALLAVPLVTTQALAFNMVVASVFAQPGARRFALARHRMICTGAALALLLLALGMLVPVLTA